MKLVMQDTSGRAVQILLDIQGYMDSTDAPRVRIGFISAYADDPESFGRPCVDYDNLLEYLPGCTFDGFASDTWENEIPFIGWGEVECDAYRPGLRKLRATVQAMEMLDKASERARKRAGEDGVRCTLGHYAAEVCRTLKINYIRVWRQVDKDNPRSRQEYNVYKAPSAAFYTNDLVRKACNIIATRKGMAEVAIADQR